MGNAPEPPHATPGHGVPEAVTLDVPSRVVVKVLLIATLFIAAAFVLVELAPFFITLFVAGFLAVAADPAVRWLQRRGMSRGASVGMLLLGIVLVLSLFVAVFVPPLLEQADRAIQRAPSFLRELADNERLRTLDAQYGFMDRAISQLEDVPAQVSRQLGSVVSALVAGVFGALTIIFLMVLLLLGGGRLAKGTAQLVPQLAEPRWWTLVQGAYRNIGAYVAGTFLVALTAGTVMVVALLLLGLPYPLPLGLWMMLFTVVPLVGATIGALPALVVAFVAGGVGPGLILLAIVVAYQQLENMVIQPTIQGRVVALPPVIIFISVLIGAQLLGVLGALFAVPFAGIVQIITRQYLETRGHVEVELPPITHDGAAAAPADAAPDVADAGVASSAAGEDPSAGGGVVPSSPAAVAREGAVAGVATARDAEGQPEEGAPAGSAGTPADAD